MGTLECGDHTWSDEVMTRVVCQGKNLVGGQSTDKG